VPEEFAFEHYDGDRDLTPEMRLALRELGRFTPHMRGQFAIALSRGIQERILEVAGGPGLCAGLAVAQGLFKIRERSQLQLDLPNARLIWVHSSEAAYGALRPDLDHYLYSRCSAARRNSPRALMKAALLKQRTGVARFRDRLAPAKWRSREASR